MEFEKNFALQIPLLTTNLSEFSGSVPLEKCRSIWDPTRARFRPCFLPVVETVPAIVAAGILLTYALRLFDAYWPSWTRKFIKETKESTRGLEETRIARPSYWTYGLLFLSLVGMGGQITTIFFPKRDLIAMYPSIGWGVAAAVIITERPRTAPISLLILFISLGLAQLIVLIHTAEGLRLEHNPLVVSIIAAICGIIAILNMPLRDSALPKEGISQPFSEPTSKLRSPEDTLTPWQYMSVSWMAPLVSQGSNRQLDDDDVWDLPYEFKHERLHNKFRQLQGSVTWKLFEANGMDLVFTTTLSIIELLCSLSTPVLLQHILASMEDPNSPPTSTITYAFFSLIVRLISAQCAVFKLWYSRRAYERSRGEMITMLYEKTLNRKILGIPQEKEPEEHSNGHVNGSVQPTKTWYSNVQSLWKQVYRAISAPFKSDKGADKSKKPDQGASTGKILNLMQGDVYEVSQRLWDFPDIIIKPLGAILSVILIWRLLGWSCFIGVLVFAVTQCINILLSRYMVYWRKKSRVVTDDRLQKLNQFIESIRHLRWYGWEDTWLNEVLDARKKELSIWIIQMGLSTLLNFMNEYGSGLFISVAFWAFTTLGGRQLRVDLIFPAINLFNYLESYLRALPRLVTTLLNAYVAMGRIEDFMKEPDKEESEFVRNNEHRLELREASFAWPSVDKNVLENITLSFPPGLTVIYGEVASGKTALLQALLGELQKTAGECVLPDEMIGYCAQTPWLQSMNIRENILFGSPYEEERYKQTLDACALVPDMAILKHGDLSNIGENGIGLSGGQKARVALARAVYSRAKILFLDDPVSALDHQTAEYIAHKLFSGPLFDGRTVVLVTHRTELCHGFAKQWVELDKGKATIREPSEQYGNGNSLQRTNTNESVDEEEAKKKKDEELATASPEKFIEEEVRATGGVKMRVYWKYIKAGTLRWWSISLFFLVVVRIIDVTETWFIKSWGEGYGQVQSNSFPTDMFDRYPSPTDDVRPWLITFFLLQTVNSVFSAICFLAMFGASYFAGKHIFEDVVQRVAHAHFRFYDITPVGRLMNRLTSDMNTVDGNLGFVFTIIAWQMVGWLTSVVVIASSTPAFLVFGMGLAGVFVYNFGRFLPTSQSLRRLEKVSLSPLMSNFGTLVEGLTTIRAFCAQTRFQERVIEVVDNFQKNDHFYWSLQAWLMYRFDALSGCSTFAVTLIAVYMGLSPGLTAFVLIAAGKFVRTTHNICRTYGNLEMDFTSVERVVELMDLPTEPLGVINPPAWWPSQNGDIVLDKVSVRYAPHLDLALSSIDLRLPAGQNTALIGRTGSGKTTLALSLLAATPSPESGEILIDGLPIETVNKQSLRQRVTFLAQDPVLFPGNMRLNLDPLRLHTDTECSSVLSKVAGSHGWTLDTPISAAGKNLSQGQRQLVGLARAMLRRSSIIILDEATASIDFETAKKIQEVLREEMKGSTVITIAHRLEAVRNADFCVVLDKGCVVKRGRPRELLMQGVVGADMLE